MQISHVYVEVRPRLRIANVFILTKEANNPECKIKVVILPDQIVVGETGSSKIVKITVKDVIFLQDSCSGLQISDTSVSFRVQTEPQHMESGSFQAEVLSAENKLSQSLNKQECKPYLHDGVLYQVMCAYCENLLLKEEIAFQRVLPLPSVIWEEVASEWFCHKPADTCSYTLSPNLKDCLYSTCFWIVHSDILDSTKVTKREDLIFCKQCEDTIGDSQGTSFRLWRHTALWKTRNEVVQKPFSPLDSFMVMIKLIVEESVGLMCKLCLEAKVSADSFEFLLLWIMDRRLHLQKWPQELNDTKQETLNISRLCDTLYQTQEQEIQLQSESVLKVLFLHQKHESDIVRSWRKDLTVQSFTVDRAMLEEGSKYLSQWTEKLPSFSNKAGNLLIAYIPL